jgi:membrane-anchored glycerophosphoryl diester phosphodiesterase (GDPDase)
VPIKDILARDYNLDIGGCISRGWSVFKENMGVLIGSFVLIVVIALAIEKILNLIVRTVNPAQAETSMVVSQLTGFISVAISALIMGPLMGGYYAIVLKLVRRQSAVVGEVFSGFETAFKQLFLGQLVISFLTGLCLIPFKVVFINKVGPTLERMRSAAPAEVADILPQFFSALVGTLPVFLLCMIPVTFLSVSWGFTLPLIMDKNLTFGAAMNASWKMVGKHWWLVFGLTILTGLINVVGILCCGVGVLFTIPIGFAALMCAYEVIFSGRDPQRD